MKNTKVQQNMNIYNWYNSANTLIIFFFLCNNNMQEKKNQHNELINTHEPLIQFQKWHSDFINKLKLPNENIWPFQFQLK